MTYLTLIAILAARNPDDEGAWRQILLFVVLIAFVGLSSLLKSRRKPPVQPQEDQEEAAPIPPRHPPTQSKPQPPPKVQTPRPPQALSAEITETREAALIEAQEVPSAPPYTIEDSDDLRTVIISREILSPPMSLRPPGFDEPAL